MFEASPLQKRLLVVIGVLLAVGLSVLAVGAFVKFVLPKMAREPVPPPPTRREFQEFAVGSTGAMIRARYGPPSRTASRTDGGQTWYYYDMTIDENSGRIDSAATLTVIGGVCIDVSFF